MKESIFDKVVQSLKQATQHNSNIMMRPEVILWPDPDRQWETIIPILQEKQPWLIVFGTYDPSKKQGPAIWLKCMVAQILPEANWPGSETPIIYLPGISKQDFKNITVAGLAMQPLMEYQYTGTLWLQENGKEWTVAAFVQNAQTGLGMKMMQDNPTKDALLTALPTIFQDQDVFYNKTFVDAEFLLSAVFPDIVHNILKWMSEGDSFLINLSLEKRETFINLCKSRYNVEPDYRNIKEIALMLGSRKNAWDHVWQYFANAPRKYPKIPELLRLAIPDDLGTGIFSLPEDSWPQINEEREDELRKMLASLSKKHAGDVSAKLTELESKNKERRTWVWTELGQSPLVKALEYLIVMSAICIKSFPFDSIPAMVKYYKTTGYQADQAMRKAYASVKSSKDKEIIEGIITVVYRPWLESITLKFQDLIIDDNTLTPEYCIEEENDVFVLFVDAFRFELAKEFIDILQNTTYNIELDYTWTALPSVTSTAKPQSSPIANFVSKESQCNEFRPQLISGKDLQISAFREALKTRGFEDISSIVELDPDKRGWFEIGDVDKKGHAEQAEVVKRIDELFETIREVVDTAIEKGIKKIKIVTDHGWLLLPGGLPKTELPKELTETRWGRCALIKEGVKTKLIQLPWHWNPSVFIAYAPGITFFKKNEEYAHGGLSLHECLIPIITIENKTPSHKPARIDTIKWINLTCKIEVADAPDDYLVDIRTKYSDSSTSIVISSIKNVKDGKCTLMVDEEAEGKSAVVVVMTSEEIIHDKKPTLVGH